MLCFVENIAQRLASFTGAAKNKNSAEMASHDKPADKKAMITNNPHAWSESSTSRMMSLSVSASTLLSDVTSSWLHAFSFGTCIGGERSGPCNHMRAQSEKLFPKMVNLESLFKPEVNIEKSI
jgi:hypothetical protein